MCASKQNIVSSARILLDKELFEESVLKENLGLLFDLASDN